MTAPVRLQLSRRKGFDLQALSLATNGLAAVSVARPHRWGNCWTVGSARWDPMIHAFRPCRDIEDAVAAFRQCVDWDPKPFMGYGPGHRNRKTAAVELGGKNLACWCRPGAPCHADVLLELANRP